eukprot:CAMPEP_0119544782 /NCGR_PEP_ID=MMETSP1344-20130328/54908_1 /TAXON_ID=236787 /ORGANISM="Florenciella parvula, Strain CCMP2471" /LENGTH=318 /DNA_ID=CAMNT_0007589289 /DNA_START=546 /DNA_END=1502 /DNA_ORIENTATION=+
MGSANSIGRSDSEPTNVIVDRLDRIVCDSSYEIYPEDSYHALNSRGLGMIQDFMTPLQVPSRARFRRISGRRTAGGGGGGGGYGGAGRRRTSTSNATTGSESKDESRDDSLDPDPVNNTPFGSSVGYDTEYEYDDDDIDRVRSIRRKSQRTGDDDALSLDKLLEHQRRGSDSYSNDFEPSEPTGVTDRYHRGGLYRDGQRNGFEGTMMKRLADSRSFDEHKRTTRAIIELTSEDEDENDGEGDSEGGDEDVNGTSTSTSSPTATRTATLTTSPTTTDSTGVDLNKRISLSPADLHKLHGSCSDDPDLDLGLGHDFDLT